MSSCSFLDTHIWDKLAAVAFQPVARNERSSADVKCSPTFEFLNVYRKGDGPQTAQNGIDTPDTDLSDDEWYDWRNKIWRISAQRVRGNHRCPYPLELAERVVRLYSYRFDICLDPFVGSGTTAAAAVLHGRLYIGIDNDPLAVKDARERLEKSKGDALTVAATISNYEPLPAKEKADDIARRIQTVQKHKRKQLQQAFRKEVGRNRPVVTAAGCEPPKASRVQGTAAA